MSRVIPKPCRVVPIGGCCQAGGKWSLDAIVKMLIETPHSQLVFYASDIILPSDQLQLLIYKSGPRQGMVKRSTRAQGGSVVVAPYQVANTIRRDLQYPIIAKSFFTFISSPGFGLYPESDNHDFQRGYQQMMPVSVCDHLVA